MFKKEQIEEHISALKEYFFVPLKKIFKKNFYWWKKNQNFVRFRRIYSNQICNHYSTHAVWLFKNKNWNKTCHVVWWWAIFKIYWYCQVEYLHRLYSRPLPLLLFLSCKQQSMQQYGFSNRCFSPHFRWWEKKRTGRFNLSKRNQRFWWKSKIHSLENLLRRRMFWKKFSRFI